MLIQTTGASNPAQCGGETTDLSQAVVSSSRSCACLAVLAEEPILTGRRGRDRNEWRARWQAWARQRDAVCN